MKKAKGWRMRYPFPRADLCLEEPSLLQPNAKRRRPGEKMSREIYEERQTCEDQKCAAIAKEVKQEQLRFIEKK